MNAMEDLRKRIDTTEDLQSIVRTMKALAAVSIRQYEHAVASLAEYARTVDLGLQVTLRGFEQPPGARTEDAGGVTAVVFGSDYGLCGRFNEEIVRHLFRELDARGIPRQDARVLAVGIRAGAHLEAQGLPPARVEFLPRSIGTVTETVRSVLLRADRWRREDGRTRALVFHNRQTERSTAAPQVVPLFPLEPERFAGLAERAWPTNQLPMALMDRADLFAALVREHLFVTLFRACAESLASENASRLAAMQTAERNIKDQLEDMGLQYRQQRQTQITAELLDVVAGFESTRAD